MVDVCVVCRKRTGPSGEQVVRFLLRFTSRAVGPSSSNPVIESRGRSRPAGRLFWSNGRLVRPAQESVGAYGEGILFYEITALSRSEFVERLIGRWERSDDWSFPSGMHHIERLGHNSVMIDAKRYPNVRPNPGVVVGQKLEQNSKKLFDAGWVGCPRKPESSRPDDAIKSNRKRSRDRGCRFYRQPSLPRDSQSSADLRVVALDNLRRRGSELQVPRLLAGVEFVHGDVRNPEDLEQIGRLTSLWTLPRRHPCWPGLRKSLGMSFVPTSWVGQLS